MIIGICGGTGSGKTTIARRVIESVGRESLIMIEQDSYYRNLEDMPLDERCRANFDHPDAIDFEHLSEDIRGLKAGRAVEIPVYDFPTHCRKPETEYTEPRPVVIVEGILIFAVKQLVDLFDLKVFVDTPDDIRFIRRLQRDVAERGRTVDSVIAQYFATVRPMHHEFVAPSRGKADIIIPESTNADIGIELLCEKIREEIVRKSTSEFAG